MVWIYKKKCVWAFSVRDVPFNSNAWAKIMEVQIVWQMISKNYNYLLFWTWNIDQALLLTVQLGMELCTWFVWAKINMTLCTQSTWIKTSFYKSIHLKVRKYKNYWQIYVNWRVPVMWEMSIIHSSKPYHVRRNLEQCLNKKTLTCLLESIL